MEKDSTRPVKRWTMTSVTWMALTTGLYMVVMLVLSVFSFGVIQICLLEMFNYLSLYNKRYIVAIIAGIALVNITSPLGLVDVAVGGVNTLLVLLINYRITSRIKNMKIKMAVIVCVFALSMPTVAGQLAILYRLFFFLNRRMIILGEPASMIVGGIITCQIGKKADLLE